MMAQINRNLLTVAQSATLIKVKERTIREWVAKGLLACVRIGRIIRIPESEIDRFVQENTIPRKS
jgi:excisionase family DNA binding protein